MTYQFNPGEREGILAARYGYDRERAVYLIGDGALCDACLADTFDKVRAVASIDGRDDTAHCLGCDYHPEQYRAVCLTCGGFTRIEFVFVDSPVFKGWTDGSTWNGFANVRVTRETLDAIRAWLVKEEPWTANEPGYWPTKTDIYGLFDLGGSFAAEETSR